MGSSFVDYGAKGFEANDAMLAVWLILLVNEMDKRGNLPDWLRTLRDDWELQATEQFDYGVIPMLDQLDAHEGAKELILSFCGPALRRLESMGDPIPQAALNGLHEWGEDREFTGDVDAAQFLRTARYFTKLLEGRLAADEVDARFDTASAR